MAKPKDIDIHPWEPYRVAAARVVRVRAEELFAHEDGVLDTGDIERVHDMRVATRRLRAVLEIFAPCFPRGDYKVVLGEVKALADALGERRDRDVAIAALEGFAEGLPAADRPGVASLVATMRAEQATANGELAPFVSRERIDGLSQRLDELVTHASPEGTG